MCGQAADREFLSQSSEEEERECVSLSRRETASVNIETCWRGGEEMSPVALLLVSVSLRNKRALLDGE